MFVNLVRFGGSLTVFNSGTLPDNVNELGLAANAYTGGTTSGQKTVKWPVHFYRINIPELEGDIQVPLIEVERFVHPQFPVSQMRGDKPNWWRYLLAFFYDNNVPVKGYDSDFPLDPVSKDH